MPLRGARDRVPAGWVGVFRVGRWSRVPPAVPRQAPTRDAPTIPAGDARTMRPAGAAGGFPFSRGRRRRATGKTALWAAWRVVAGDDSPRRAPPGAHKGRPYGSCGTTPLRVLRDDAPTGPAGRRPYGSCGTTPLRVLPDDAPTGPAGRRPYGSCRTTPLRFLPGDASTGPAEGRPYDAPCGCGRWIPVFTGKRRRATGKTALWAAWRVVVGLRSSAGGGGGVGAASR